MIERPTPIQARDGFPFMVVKVEGIGDHHMKIPSMLKVTKLIKASDQVAWAIMVAMKPDRDQNVLLTMMKDAGPELMAAAGCLIGWAWNHQTIALETSQADFKGDPQGYGEAVYEELHDNGYALDTIAQLGMVIIRAIWEHSQFTDAVSQRAAFFFPLMAQKRPSDLTVESNTSETLGASGN